MYDEEEDPPEAHEDSFFETNDFRQVVSIKLPPETVALMKAASEAGKAAAAEETVLLMEHRFFGPNSADDAKAYGELETMPIVFNGYEVESEVAGIVSAEKYDSKRQHYIFLVDGDIWQEGDQFWYTGEGWIEVQKEFIGKPVQASKNYPDSYRRKVV